MLNEFNDEGYEPSDDYGIGSGLLRTLTVIAIFVSLALLMIFA
jgi:hypothetical protein